jgi:hypothetical protein
VLCLVMMPSTHYASADNPFIGPRTRSTTLLYCQLHTYCQLRTYFHYHTYFPDSCSTKVTLVLMQVTLVVLGAASLAVPMGQPYTDAGATAYLGTPSNPVTHIIATGGLCHFKYAGGVKGNLGLLGLTMEKDGWRAHRAVAYFAMPACSISHLSADTGDQPGLPFENLRPGALRPLGKPQCTSCHICHSLSACCQVTWVTP